MSLLSPSFESAVAIAAFAMLLAPGCADDAIVGEDEVADAGEGADADAGEGADTDNDAGEGADADSGEDEGPPPELGGPAMGISITDVEVNQGAGVRVANADVYVPIEQRNAYLVHHRDSLVRFQHVVDGSWFPRDITGFLHIYPPGGEELVRVRTFDVEGDSDPRNLNTNFYFSVLAEEAVPGTEFWLELRESDDSIDVSGLPEGVSSSPTQPELFGFDPTSLEMKIMIVPVEYYGYDEPTYVEMRPEDLGLFHDYLLQQNPVQTVDIQIREQPMVWQDQLFNLGALLGPTRQLKVQDGADENVYYHALINVNGQSVSMVAGIANLAGATKSDSDLRVAATVYHRPINEGDEEEGTEDVILLPATSGRTWVHELGHNQGFRHVACPNADAAGPDPGYPYADGLLGVYGFGIRDYHIYTPGASHDYMSYCGNAWVSDWTWNKAFARISTLTAWDNEDAAPGGGTTREPLLVGYLFADGREDWWVLDGVAPSEPSGEQRLELIDDDQLIATSYADVVTLSDGETLMVTAPLPLEDPAELAQLDGIVRVTANDVQIPVELARIHVGPLKAAP